MQHQLIVSKKRAWKFPSYAPSKRAWEVLTHGKIVAKDETPQQLLERVITTIFSVEDEFGVQSEETKKVAEEFAECMITGCVILGTPTLTNAGRQNAALSSCAIIPVDLRKLNATTEEQILSYYKQNMGTGFTFTSYDDPVAILNWLNELAARETATEQYERYIGNMGILHISHPRVKAFIEAKHDKDMKHFNISIDVSEDFMRRAENAMPFYLADGTRVDAAALLEQMAENAWYNGDPGLIFLERMNHDNALAEISKYVSTPPCAEMGLAEGETSQFGYLNLRNFVRRSGKAVTVDYDKVECVTTLLTRALDNAIEYSMQRYPTSVSRDIARLKRKMGIGVCGLADMLIALKLPYDSQEARNVARDVLSFVNYTSKRTSVALAEQRGSCLAMSFPTANKYISGHFLEEKYAQYPTRTVSSQDWEQLANIIRATGKLRNISTTALAPTGRASILLDVTSSIEPLFSIFTSDGSLQSSVHDLLSQVLGGNEEALQNVCQQATLSGSFQGLEGVPPAIYTYLKTAKEIAPIAHLQMVADLAGLQGVFDESASKTVNLLHSAKVDDVKEIFFSSFHLGLKNISVYRDKTKVGQPMQV